MLPGLIAARIIFSKLAGGAAPARPIVRRPFHNRYSDGLRVRATHCRLSTSNQFRRKTPIITTESYAENQQSSKKIDNFAADNFKRSTDQKRQGDETGESDESSNGGNIDWIPIYRFDLILWAGFISRLKIAQTALVVGAVPFVTFLYFQKQVDLDLVITVSSLGLLGMGMLYAMSGYLRRCIGVISIHPNLQEIRIGYLTFWGWRRNVVVPVEDIIPLDDCNVELGRNRQRPPYALVQRYSDAKFKLYLPLFKYSIEEEEKFENVFGKIMYAELNKKKIE